MTCSRLISWYSSALPVSPCQVDATPVLRSNYEHATTSNALSGRVFPWSNSSAQELVFSQLEMAYTGHSCRRFRSASGADGCDLCGDEKFRRRERVGISGAN